MSLMPFFAPLIVGWTPADITSLRWWDLGDASTLWEDTSATDSVTTAGDDIARIDDKSGNSANMTAIGTVDMTYLSGGGGDKADTDNGYTASLTGQTGTYSVFFVVNIPTDAVFILAAPTNGGSTWLGLGYDGTTDAIAANSGTVTTFIDQVEVTGNGNDFHDTLVGNGKSVVELRGVSFASWSNTFQFSNYPSGYGVGCELFEILIVDTTTANSNRTEIHNYFNAKWGI